jgi:hypothetical protein
MEKAERKKLESLEKIIRTELDSNPVYKPFFDRFSEYSLKSFKDIWAYRKADLQLYSDFYIDMAEKYEAEHLETAKEKLWEIQQRKLFDLQCRWRANEIKIEGVSAVCDFEFWERYIMNCPFLSPISQEEYDLYVEFVENSSWYDVFFDVYQDCGWQDYNDFKAYYFGKEEVDNKPNAWYKYYEEATGLSSLYLLPDLREAKEEEYREFEREYRLNKEKKEGKETHKSSPWYQNELPTLHYDDPGAIQQFVDECESGELSFLNVCYENVINNSVDDELEEAFNVLKRADETVFLSTEKEWRQSIIDGANDFIKKKLIDELPKAYKSYLFRLNSKIPFECKSDDHRNLYVKIRDKKKEWILAGRELKGEPRNFDF